MSIKVNDFDRVKKGDIILQIDPSDYEAKRDQAKASLDSALAQLDNLTNQENLEKAAIQQAEAQATVTRANADLAKTEAARQRLLIDRGAGIQQNKDEAEAKVQTTVASLGAAQAAVLWAKAQLQIY
ncbi:biotin/lipoyl-binding protein [Shinella sumterensis]|uniref:biotin/lipoyl-binding protein n=1 Tax=Shinella sumterensis TaxID=1967501 RepID=UPI001E510C6A|nr:biotin/lipoyl-binding protein [Shinella sumterensis]